jgi:hypothetical protein
VGFKWIHHKKAISFKLALLFITGVETGLVEWGCCSKEGIAAKIDCGGMFGGGRLGIVGVGVLSGLNIGGRSLPDFSSFLLIHPDFSIKSNSFPVLFTSFWSDYGEKNA